MRAARAPRFLRGGSPHGPPSQSCWISRRPPRSHDRTAGTAASLAADSLPDQPFLAERGAPFTGPTTVGIGASNRRLQASFRSQKALLKGTRLGANAFSLQK